MTSRYRGPSRPLRGQSSQARWPRCQGLATDRPWQECRQVAPWLQCLHSNLNLVRFSIEPFYRLLNHSTVTAIGLQPDPGSIGHSLGQKGKSLFSLANAPPGRLGLGPKTHFSVAFQILVAALSFGSEPLVCAMVQKILRLSSAVLCSLALAGYLCPFDFRILSHRNSSSDLSRGGGGLRSMLRRLCSDRASVQAH